MGILVIGDVMLDKYWFSHANALASEEPVLNVNVDDEHYRAGGAANVALNIKQLAHPETKIAVLAPLGNDGDGNILSSILESSDIICHWLKHENSKTITKHRIISQNKQLVRVDFEDKNAPVELTSDLMRFIDGYKVIVISDYNKGALGEVQSIIAYAKSKRKYILVDPKGQDFSKYTSATLLTPNLNEFTNIVGDISSEQELDHKANKLIGKLELDHILVTRSSDGMTLYSKDGEKYHACSYAEQVYDVTGAGDTVIASLAVSLFEDKDRKIAVEYASHAAALVVSQVGTASVSRCQVAKNMLINKSVNINKDNVTEKIINIVSDHELIQNLSEYNNLFIWDSAEHNILTAKNVTVLLKYMGATYNPDNLINVIIKSSIDERARNDGCSGKGKKPHNQEQLALMLASLKFVAKVLYSNSLDLSQIILDSKYSSFKTNMHEEVVV